MRTTARTSVLYWAIGTAMAAAAPLSAAEQGAAADQTMPAVSRPAPPAAQAANAMAIARAPVLWAHDQAAWHSTDVMLAMLKKATPEQRTAMDSVRGWVVTADAKGWLVVYYAPTATGPRAVFSAIWTGQGKAVVDPGWHVGTPYAWSDEQIGLIRATILVRRPSSTCTEGNMNRVVMSDPAVAGQILVYDMTPQKDTGVIPFGKHRRVAVKDGAVVDQFYATNSCIALPAPKKAGQQPVSMTIANFTADTPTEFHLFAARTAQMPVVTFGKDDKPNYIVGWDDGTAFIEPFTDFKLLDKYVK